MINYLSKSKLLLQVKPSKLIRTKIKTEQMRWSRRIRRLPPTNTIPLEKIKQRKLHNLNQQEQNGSTANKNVILKQGKKKKRKRRTLLSPRKSKSVKKEPPIMCLLHNSPKFSEPGLRNTFEDCPLKAWRLRRSNLEIKADDLFQVPKVKLKKDAEKTFEDSPSKVWKVRNSGLTTKDSSISEVPKLKLKKTVQKSIANSFHLQIQDNFSSRKQVILKREKRSPKKTYKATGKFPVKVKLEPLTPPGQLKRKQYVLEILNYGNLKQIGKLHSIGPKTAESIILFRQLKGLFTKLSQLSKLPAWHISRYKKFIAHNFLKDDANER